MKEYEVSGEVNVFGHSPGDVFKADIPEAQEQRLLQRGQLRVIADEDSDDDDATISTDFGDDDDNNTGEDAGEGTYS